MKAKVFKMDDYKKELKKRERKEKAKRMINDGLIWIDKNRELLALAIPAVVVSVKGGARIVTGISKNVRLHQEKVDKEKKNL